MKLLECHRNKLHSVIRLPDLIVPGGLLFITSPYMWLESYTENVKGEEKGEEGGRGRREWELAIGGEESQWAQLS